MSLTLLLWNANQENTHMANNDGNVETNVGMGDE